MRITEDDGRLQILYICSPAARLQSVGCSDRSSMMALLRVCYLILLLGGFWQLSVSANKDASVCAEVSSAAYVPGVDLTAMDKQLLAFPLNLEYLETEFFAWSAFGYGLDKIDPSLTGDGPAPKGVQKANLDPLVLDIIAQFAYQEVGHVRAIRTTIKEESFPRPQLDVSVDTFATTFDKAFGVKLDPPFNPYANSLNYMLASYVIPYVGLNGYVGTNPKLHGPVAKRLLAGLLAVEAGQDAVVRGYLYERKDLKVEPYSYTVAEFTNKLSALRNNLDSATGVDDEGLVVQECLGADGKIEGNVLVGDQYSVAFARTSEQVLQIVYGTGDASKPGGFYPKGANGKEAAKYRKKRVAPPKLSL